MSTNFTDILDQEIPEVIKRPPPMPVGVYQWVITGPYVAGKTKNDNPFIEFPIACQGVVQADEDQLEEFGSPVGRNMRMTFYTKDDPNNIYRLDHFLNEVLGFESGVSRRQALSEAVNRPFVAAIKHAPSADGSQIYANIDMNSLAAV